METECLRCGCFFIGNGGCPHCEDDKESIPVNPPAWFNGDTFTSHAFGVRIPILDKPWGKPTPLE